ncbi:MAG: hypothetical protein K0R40_2249 [Burkholderiales bacterium]|nr:hypothetical protein [Burkholderiales bacterium]
MSAMTVVLAASGIVCLLISAFMMYKMIPREGVPPPAWMKSDVGESGMALGQFTLMVAGLALLAKSVF